MAELTPMKRQYYEIKQRNPDCLLFFRLGDFYEMFDDDARLAARELDLTLTTRDRNVEDPAERTPMCGVPYHSAEAYIGRLIAKGYKVAICEQLEDPALAKGLVDRDVIRIITPGTVTASSMLEENKSNYLCAVYLSAQSGGTAFCDLSTGEFCAANYPADAVSHILNELGRFAPREAVCADAAAEKLRGFDMCCLVVCAAGWVPTHAVIRVTDQYRHIPMLLWGMCGWKENGRIITTAEQAGTTANSPTYVLFF